MKQIVSKILLEKKSENFEKIYTKKANNNILRLCKNVL